MLIGKKEGSKDRDAVGSKGKGGIKEKVTASQGKDVVNPLSLGLEMTTVTKGSTDEFEVINPITAMNAGSRKEHGKKH